jgi:hypothetical protein
MCIQGLTNKLAALHLQGQQEKSMLLHCLHATGELNIGVHTTAALHTSAASSGLSAAFLSCVAPPAAAAAMTPATPKL